MKDSIEALTRETLLAAMSRTVTTKGIPVEMPEWGRTVYVRPQTVYEADVDATENPKEKGMRLAAGVARILCDKEGNRIMLQPSAEELQKLSKQPWTLLQRLIEKSLDFGDDKEADAKKPSGVSS